MKKAEDTVKDCEEIDTAKGNITQHNKKKVTTVSIKNQTCKFCKLVFSNRSNKYRHETFSQSQSTTDNSGTVIYNNYYVGTVSDLEYLKADQTAPKVTVQ